MDEELLRKISDDLDAIKRLMIFNLLNDGISQAKVAESIGTSQASISRMFKRSSEKE